MSATLYGTMKPPNGVGMGAWSSAAEWEAYPGSDQPVPYGSWYHFPLAADDTPSLKRRSEIKPGPSLEETKAAVGMTTHFEGWILPRLGAAGAQLRNWHCVVQLIGPNYDGTYSGGAAVSLMVRDGRWVLSHGNQNSWVVDLGPFEEGQVLFCSIDVKLSENAETGEVSIKLGAMAAKVNVQTFWHRHLVWSCGLYRGSGNSSYDASYKNSDGTIGGPQPTHMQECFWKDILVQNIWST